MTTATLSPSLETAASLFRRYQSPMLVASLQFVVERKNDSLLLQLAQFLEKSYGKVTLHFGPRECGAPICKTRLLQITLPMEAGLTLSAFVGAATTFLFFAGFLDMALFIIDQQGAALQLFFSGREDLSWRRFWFTDGRAARG